MFFGSFCFTNADVCVIIDKNREWGTLKMPRGSKALRFVGIVEVINSVFMLIWMLYLYIDYRTSPAKAFVDALNSNYGTIRLLIVIFQLYKLIIAAYVIKRGDYVESAIPIIFNGFLLAAASGAFLYYAVNDFMNVKNALNSVRYYITDYSMWRETTTLISASADMLLVIVMIVAGYMNKPKTVFVNSWGDPSKLPAVNNTPSYTQQEATQQDYYGGQYYDNAQVYDNTQGYGEQYYEQPQQDHCADGQYYDDGQYYEQPQEYYEQGDNTQQ